MIVQPIPSARTHPLRQEVLRPGQPPSGMVFQGDDEPGARHLGLFIDDQPGQAPIGIASVYQEPFPADAATGDWRLRGMAVSGAHRGCGGGRCLARACMNHVRGEGGRRLWCNARLGARGFYEKLGFTIAGEVFHIQGIGPHYVMSIQIQ